MLLFDKATSALMSAKQHAKQMSLLQAGDMSTSYFSRQEWR